MTAQGFDEMRQALAMTGPLSATDLSPTPLRGPQIVPAIPPRPGKTKSEPERPGRVRILVVDDFEMNLELLGVTLGRLGYEVATAGGGEAALRAVEMSVPDVVLMDVLMPGLSGLDVLKRLRAQESTADLPVILVSGLGETSHIVEGLGLGANDYVTKPIDMPVLQARLATQAALKRARDDLKRTAFLLAAEIERNDRELLVAAHVQRMILPRSAPDSLALQTAWCYEPATEVGGDLFDVIPLPGGKTLLFIADAMGHGVQAALVAAIVKATLVTRLDGVADDLPGLLVRLDEMVGGMFDDRFVTAAACVVDPAARRLRYAVAGHPPLLIRGPEGVVSLDAGGLPLGTQMGRIFGGGEVDFEPGSTILLYSDGVTEASGPDGEQFGSTALADCLARAPFGVSPADIIASIRLEVDLFRGSVPLADDLTILAARLSDLT